jgi:ubiquinone/menaquinone biosynthesis C-methylase UbiE
VLDVAAGNGNATLAAARRFATVTSTDYVPELLERGRRRAEAEGARITFQVADAEDLQFPDASFDVVLSTFGVMFAPDHEKAAAEMMRVCRPGGRIGLASWTPTGFLGKLFRVVANHVPPIPGVRSPLLWGTDAHCQELFKGVASIRQNARHFAFRYRSPEHFVEIFRAPTTARRTRRSRLLKRRNRLRSRATCSPCCANPIAAMPPVSSSRLNTWSP